MAHGIESEDKFGEVRSGGLRAWHGLGDELEAGLSATEAFKKTGIDWETELLRMVGVDSEGNAIPTDAVRLHVRKKDKLELAVVGKRYVPFQNMQMAEFGDTLLGEDAAMNVETCGTLLNCKRVFCLMRLPKTIEVVRDDVIKMYVLLNSSHDGSCSFQLFPTSIRVVCRNTLSLAQSADLSKGLRMRHTASISTEERIKQAQACLGLVISSTKVYEEEIQRLVGVQLNEKQLVEYFSKVYDKHYNAADEEDVVVGKDAKEVINDHKIKIVRRWMALFESENQSIPGIKGTLWAAFNSITEWSDHERGVADPYDDNRMNNNFVGASALQKRRIWGQTLAVASRLS